MTEYASWFIVGAALLGTWLNIQKDQRCFWIWCCTNGFWCMYDAWHELYAQAFLFAVYFVLAVVGIWKWRK